MSTILDTLQQESLLHRIRAAELESLLEWLMPDMRVLELGGGDGFQAGVLSSRVSELVSIDIGDRPEYDKTYYDVQEYDGRSIPFPDSSFDLVFSSNVLEHISDLPGIFSEFHRVLRPDGLCIHILPSATWRLWTSLTHYGFILRYVLGKIFPGKGGGGKRSPARLKRKKGIAYLIRRALVAGPHGEYPSAVSELYYFSRKRWSDVFKRNGFTIVHSSGNGLFYDGYDFFSSLSMKTRRRLSSILGSSCHIFVLKPDRVQDAG